MVNIAGSDIPNLSKIVEETFDSIGSIYHGNMIEFDEVDTDIDISMNTDMDDYIPDMSDVSNDE
jgi:PHP family Zn ribbon phosphoesterase